MRRDCLAVPISLERVNVGIFIDPMCVQHCDGTRCHWLIHLKEVNVLFCEFPFH